VRNNPFEEKSAREKIRDSSFSFGTDRNNRSVSSRIQHTINKDQNTLR